MIQPGEIYMADLGRAFPHPVVVVSREDLNRGRYVVAAVITSAKFSVCSQLSNCVPLRAGQFGLTKDCVVQGETVSPVPLDQLDLAAGPVGVLNDITLREVIRAVGYVMDADCEPA
jgi:mRNA-degrading endonuclease toxin of MazEF toxin-antitoxin module